MQRPFRFVHCADLHLDSPFEGLRRQEPALAERLAEATFEAFANVVDLALTENAELLLVAGDVYDAAESSLGAQLRFLRTVERAAAAGVRVFIAHGNHDPLDGWQADLELPAGVHRFGAEPERCRVELDDGPAVAVLGVSHPRPALKENLARRLAPLAAQSPEADFTIALVHANVGGREGHDDYAPAALADLAAPGIDYWALGHIHAGAVLCAHRPCVVYAGTPQGRRLDERGPRGAWLVEVGAGGRPRPRPIACDAVRWEAATVDAGGCATPGELVTALRTEREAARRRADGRAVLLRITVGGRSPLAAELARLEPERDLVAALNAEERERSDAVWITAVELAVRSPIDLDARRRIDDLAGYFLRASERARRNPERLRRRLAAQPGAGEIAGYLARLRHHELERILDEAETLGIEALLAGEP